ncbi:MAG: hypothetical protein IT305_31180 [Chloroflexi bacterium]|nr:hypothetical protein [Chloroflexota bacterium]
MVGRGVVLADARTPIERRSELVGTLFATLGRAAGRAAGLEGATSRSRVDLWALDAWLASSSRRALALDAAVIPTVVAEWLEEVFRGHEQEATRAAYRRPDRQSDGAGHRHGRKGEAVRPASLPGYTRREQPGVRDPGASDTRADVGHHVKGAGQR